MPAASTNLVVDASFILSFLLPDEKKAETDEVFVKFQKGQVIFLSNRLLPFEVLNSLKLAFIRKRISRTQAIELMEVFLDYKIQLKDTEFDETFNLALEEDLTVYDASYLYLARKLDVPLLTLDNQLKKLS